MNGSGRIIATKASFSAVKALQTFILSFLLTPGVISLLKGFAFNATRLLWAVEESFISSFCLFYVKLGDKYTTKSLGSSEKSPKEDKNCVSFWFWEVSLSTFSVTYFIHPLCIHFILFNFLLVWLFYQTIMLYDGWRLPGDSTYISWISVSWISN